MNYIWQQKVGTKSGKKRVTIWNLKLIEAGFNFGQGIKIETLTSQDGYTIQLTPCDDSKRKILKVMNHGKALPVVEFTGGILDQFTEGDKVTIEVKPNLIKIHQKPFKN
jgi:hypothetical protein